MNRTRVIDLEHEDLRSGAPAHVTCMDRGSLRSAPRDFDELFARGWSALRATLRRFRRPGVAVFGMDARGAVAGSVCLAAKPDAVTSAILGRHPAADFFLPADPAISLRHLAVLVHPLRGSTPRFSVLDLRTGGGFEDEHGNGRDALVADGSVFFRSGRYSFFVFVTGGHADRPADPRAAWAALPPRRYVDAPHARAPREEEDSGRAITIVSRVSAPSPLRRALGDEGNPIGELRVTSHDRVCRITLGPKAAREGVLIGRYDRCDTNAVGLLQDDRVSRVHLLVIELEGQLFAVDTASTNGTNLVGGEPCRDFRLEYGARLELGGPRTVVSWLPLN
jgi:hypothetical protein